MFNVLVNSELSNFLGLDFSLVPMFPWQSTTSCGLLVAMSLFLGANGLTGAAGASVGLEKVRAPVSKACGLAAMALQPGSTTAGTCRATAMPAGTMLDQRSVGLGAGVAMPDQRSVDLGAAMPDRRCVGLTGSQVGGGLVVSQVRGS